MEFICIESARDCGWAVEAIDHDGEGEITRILFMGANDEALAKEYAAWKNSVSNTKSQHQSDRRKSVALND